MPVGKTYTRDEIEALSGAPPSWPYSKEPLQWEARDDCWLLWTAYITPPLLSDVCVGDEWRIKLYYRRSFESWDFGPRAPGTQILEVIVGTGIVATTPDGHIFRALGICKLDTELRDGADGIRQLVQDELLHLREAFETWRGDGEA